MRHIIEVTRTGTDKSTGAKKLLDIIGVHDPKHIIAIGDDKNDIPMIESFNGYVVENGNPEVVKTVLAHRRVPHLHNLITEKLSP
jgi:hydroxymethylpyrimidine pyrophosphatase-like HAD family hydrolase